MSIVQVLRRDIYPRLDHRRVFGELEGWEEGGACLVASCPLCKAAGGFRMEPNRAHGFCGTKCGRISWWGYPRRALSLEPLETLRWLAEHQCQYLMARSHFSKMHV